MNEQDRHHQAKQLEKLFQEVRDHEDNLPQQYQSDANEASETVQSKIDVLNLPPRREIHEVHEKGFKFKLSQSFWRLLIVIIILLIVTIFVIYDRFVLEKMTIFNVPTHFLSEMAVLFSYTWR